MQENLADLSFEAAFSELQRVVEQLRGDAMTLDTSIALFERGNALSEHCNALLTAAELRVSVSAPQGRRESTEDLLELDVDW